MSDHDHGHALHEPLSPPPEHSEVRMTHDIDVHSHNIPSHNDYSTDVHMHNHNVDVIVSHTDVVVTHTDSDNSGIHDHDASDAKIHRGELDLNVDDNMGNMGGQED